MDNTNAEKKHGNKGLLVAAVLCFVVTVVLIIVLISCVQIEVPHMGHDDWFDLSSKKSAGIAFSIFGIVVTLMVGGILLSLYFRAPQRAMRSGVNSLASTITTLREAIFPTPKPAEKQYCSYCGMQLEENEKFCSACGGARKKPKAE